MIELPGRTLTELIRRSSLGTPKALRLQSLTSEAVVEQVLSGALKRPTSGPMPERSTTRLWELAPFDPAAAFEIALDVAADLEILHRRGLLHGDLHPGNVIVDGSGRAALTGLSTTRHGDGGLTTMASSGTGFIPPECVHGPDTAASDRWGLGMLTVFALLGHPQGSTGPKRLRAALQDALASIGRRQQAVDLLARMIDNHPDCRPTDITAWARSLAACLSPRSARRRLLFPVAAAVAAVLASTGLAALAGEEDIVSRAVTTTSCDPVVDDIASGTATVSPPLPPNQVPGDAPAEGPRWGLLDDAVRELGGGACLGGPPEAFAQATVQSLVDRDGRPDGVVLVSPDGDGVRLTQAMWQSYVTTRGRRQAVNEPPRGGYPTRVERRREPDAVVVTLDRSGVLIGPRSDTQLFWIPAQLFETWQTEYGGADGALGFPMSNPYADDTGLHQEFERGTVHAYGTPSEIADMAAGGPVSPEVEMQTPPPLTDRSVEIAEHIVQQAGGTAWWIDAEGVRHWIPDATVLDCLGGANVVALNRLRGADVATLPLGPPATCP